MTTKKRILAVVLTAVLIISASFCGSYLKEREERLARMERCNIYLSFALDKVNNADLSDEPTMKSLISNIYAAYRFCDDDYKAYQLSEIWNALLFDSDAYAGREELLASQLSDICQMEK